jgi:hypothetical protein
MTNSFVEVLRDGELVHVDFGPLPEPTVEEVLQMQRAARAAAYQSESDPLFFKAQRGEATEQEWLDKIEEIRARYPYPEDTEQ